MFNEQKKKVLDLEYKIYQLRKDLVKLESEYTKETNQLYQLCEKHEWVKDIDSYDHSSHYECKFCGYYR
jgi:hypothetical protein